MPFRNYSITKGGALTIGSIHSPNFNVANPSASPNPSWAALKNGILYAFGLVLSGGTITGPDYIINSSGIFIYSGTPANGNLIGSWAGASGTDAFGNTYPQGLNVTMGSITGTTFTGNDFIINSTGAFFYSGTPASGNLVFSIAALNTTDPFGNKVLVGITSYDPLSTAATPIGISLENGSIAWNDGSGNVGLVFFADQTDASGNAFASFNVTIPPADAGPDDVAFLFAGSGNSAATTTPFWQFTSASADSTTFVDNLEVADNEFVLGSSTSPEYLSYGAASTGGSATFTSGSGHWTVPTGVTSVTVQCWGAGGGGAGGANSPTGGGEGGGGGAYASSILTVTPGTSIPYTVGAGGAGGAVNNLGSNGHDTTFNTTSVVAKAGLAATISSVGLGGTAAASTGNSKHNGGNGGSATSTGGSGGGGSAGSGGGGGNGGNSTSSTGGAGGAAGSGQGHAGGNGGNSGAAGGAGSTPGSGGGGGGDSSSPQAGGAGGGGRIILTWTATGGTTLEAAQAGASGTDGSSNAFAQGFTGNVTAFQPGVSPTVAEVQHTASNAANMTGTLKYKLNADNSVTLKGEVVTSANTAANATVFTLPAGYRPAQVFAFMTPNNMSGYTAPARVVSIATSGVVTVVPSGTSGNFFLLDGIRFPLD